MSKEFILHVGLQKTGSTSLQHSVFRRHDEIFYLGKVTRNQIPMGCVSEGLYQFLRPILWNQLEPFDADVARSSYEDQVLIPAEGRDVVVASWEALGSLSPSRFRMLLERSLAVFGSVKLLISIRNPLTWFPSVYLQNLQGYFVRRNRHWTGKELYVDLDTWLERKIKREVLNKVVVAYSVNVPIAVDLLGLENVGLFVFEEIRKNPICFFTDIQKYMGVSPLDDPAYFNSVHYNKRLNEAQFNLIKQVGAKHDGAVNPITEQEYKQARRQFRKLADSGSPPVKLGLSPDWARVIADASKDGNREIVDIFNVDLQSHGYPL